MEQILLLSISLSVDALGVGMAYAAKGLRIPFYAKFVVGIISAVLMGLSLVAGSFIQQFLPPFVMKLFSCAILVLIGTAMIKDSLLHPDSTYDLDNSKCIGAFEALLLGMALSMDTAAAGIAVAASSLPLWPVPVFSALMQIGFLWTGEIVVKKLGGMFHWNKKLCGIFSGCLLFLLAFLFFRE